MQGMLMYLHFSKSSVYTIHMALHHIINARTLCWIPSVLFHRQDMFVFKVVNETLVAIIRFGLSQILKPKARSTLCTLCPNSCTDKLEASYPGSPLHVQ